MLKFCLTLDCERFTSFSQGNPGWNNWQRLKGRVNNLIKNFRCNLNGFELVYGEIKRQRFPCTFMLVGRLFKPIDDLEFVEWGYHTKNHLPLTLLSDSVGEGEVENIYSVESITCPMWMVEDRKDPSRIFKILKKNGYENTVYHGPSSGVNCFHELSVRPPEIKSGIKCIHVSNWFEGHWPKWRIENIKRDIIKNLNKDAVYLLSSHDFTHKNLRNLKSIMGFVRNLEREGLVKIVRLKNA